MSRKVVRLSPLLWHRKSYPRLGGSTILTSVIWDSFDKNLLGALDGSLGFLLGGLGGSLGLTSGALGCSSVCLGALLASFWVLSRCLLRHPLGAPGCPKTTFKQHSRLKRRFFENAIILKGILSFLTPDERAWELKILPRKVHRV